MTNKREKIRNKINNINQSKDTHPKIDEGLDMIIWATTFDQNEWAIIIRAKTKLEYNDNQIEMHEIY